ncbi:hypothetical protein ACHQM5_028362 [Ranunculus cassubicifolius]
MKISEMSPELRDESQSNALEELESSINEAERLSSSSSSSSLTNLCSKLRTSFNRLSSAIPYLSKSSKLQIWKLSYRLWNACVDFSNSFTIRSSKEGDEEIQIYEDHATIRQISADLLVLAGDVSGIPSPYFKSASFLFKTGLIWHDLKKFDLAANCFERATDLTTKVDISQVSDVEEQKLLLDLNIARSRTSWEVSDRNLAFTLLNRSKNYLFRSPENYKVLANQFLLFGKLVLGRNKEGDSSITEALKLMNEALDLCEKGIRIVRRPDDDGLALKTTKSKILRFMAAAHLQGQEFESVLKCIRVLREGGGDQHPCLPVLAMKGWLGLGRYAEAEKELRGMVINKGIPESIWVSAVEAYFQAAGVAGADTIKSLFLGLLGRCHVSAGAAVRVAHRVVGNGGEGSPVRTKVVAELVSDERVMSLFSGEEAAKERTSMHAVLWNCGVDHFRSKDYGTSAEIFEKSMLYVPHNVENRVLRAKCFRVLCLCHLGLSQLDQAQEYINEAEQLHPNIACAFLKFKIYLQKRDEKGAIDQLQAMTSCHDFRSDFLALSAHESIASKSIAVAIASLSNLLSFYSSGKPMPTPEVVVIRTLITVLSQGPGNESEVLKFTKLARTRMLEVSTENFFGKGEVGRRELNWFAANSWNMGTASARDKKFALCAELLELASEFYGTTIRGEVEENNVMVCKSLILSVSATITLEKQDSSAALLDSEIKRAMKLLDRAGKILSPLSSGGQAGFDPAGIEPKFFYLYTLVAYDLQGRLADTGQQQLLLIKNFASSKMCTPQYLLQIGFNSSQGPRANLEVSDYAFNTCLSTLLSSPCPNYKTIALIVRKLIGLAGVRKGDADDEAYSKYKIAHQMMVGLKEGEYPAEEVKWLAMTAWNRGSLPVRLGQVAAAKRWMRVGLELSQHSTELGKYAARMEEFITSFESKLSGG